jgi:hypothetical protein
VVVKPAGGADCPAPDADCNYSPTPQNFYFVADKNNFGHDEVSDTLTWTDAFYLFLEGYWPAGIAASLPNLTGSFNSSNVPGLTITHSGTTYDVGKTGDNANLPQPIRFAYDGAGFPTGRAADRLARGGPMPAPLGFEGPAPSSGKPGRQSSHTVTGRWATH